MEEPGRLQSMGSQRVGHDLATSLHLEKGRAGKGLGRIKTAVSERAPGIMKGCGAPAGSGNSSARY